MNRHLLTLPLLALACQDPLYGVPTDTALSDSGPVDAPTWGAHISPMLARACGEACHGGANPSAGLILSYDALVEISAAQLPSMKLVEPGAPESSYLWHKLTGTHEEVGGTGAPMPLGQSMSDANKELLYTWITDGAPE